MGDPRWWVRAGLTDPRRARRASRAALAVALLWLVVVAPIAATAQAGTAGGPTPPPGNETVVRHEDPDRVGEDTSYSDYARYLAADLAGRLGDSATRLSAEDYERARELLGAEYATTLARYGDIAERTPSDRDEAAHERFAAVVGTQRSFASDLERFNATAADYRQASRAGDTERARTLAHRLDVQMGAIEADGRALRSNYTAIAEATGVDLSAARGTVSGIVDARRAELDAIVGAEFVPTRVVVEDATSDVSFRTPLRASGRVVTANGTGVPNATVRVGSTDREVSVTTGPDGDFSLTYHPTVLRLPTTALRIEYVPRPTSPYGASNTTVPVTVTQVAPTVSVEPRPSSVAFREPLNVTGHVGADGIDAAGVPVVVTLGRQRVGRVETNATGAFRVETTVPAGLEPGERRVTAFVPLTGRALAPANATATVDVTATATTLSVSGTQAATRQVNVSGRLATANGTPLSGRAVEIVFDGQSLAVATTGGDGRFEGTVTAPRGALPNRPGGVSQPTLLARFNGTGTNLASSTGSTSVPMEADLSAFVQVNWDRLLGVGALLGLLVVVRLWYDRYRGGSADGAGLPTTSADHGAGTTSGASLLDTARSSLEAGRQEDAIQLAYAAARRRLVGEVGGVRSETHWEFYRRCRSAGWSDFGRLARLTSLYERAAFDHRPAGRDLADEAIESAASLLEALPGRSAGD